MTSRALSVFMRSTSDCSCRCCFFTYWRLLISASRSLTWSESAAHWFSSAWQRSSSVSHDFCALWCRCSTARICSCACCSRAWIVAIVFSFTPSSSSSSRARPSKCSFSWRWTSTVLSAFSTLISCRLIAVRWCSISRCHSWGAAAHAGQSPPHLRPSRPF